jgi:hypothetical protein
MATTQNRTLKFHGYAYGSSNVSLTATINGIQIFSGEVPTIDAMLPIDYIVAGDDSPILFDTGDTTLFPTDFAGSYPVTISVTGGSGIVIGDIISNWMKHPTEVFTADNCSINGTTLTIGTVTSGAVSTKSSLRSNNVLPNTRIISGSESTWTVNQSQTLAAESMSGLWYLPPSADAYFSCYFNGTPTNSEGTPDPRSSVAIDGVQQVPPTPKSNATWAWLVPTGSTIAYNLNVSAGFTG